MTYKPLNDAEKQVLLQVARQALENAANRSPLLPLNLEDYPLRLREDCATFVTLTVGGELRGCIGALEAYQPLVQDVCEHAAAAALEDYRFYPVRPEEVDAIKIEISCLTDPQPLHYEHPEDLPGLLQAGVDGVVLRDGHSKATFLPQVWERVSTPQDFLNHLCQKMGAEKSLWRKKLLQVSTYQVLEFSE